MERSRILRMRHAKVASSSLAGSTAIDFAKRISSEARYFDVVPERSKGAVLSTAVLYARVGSNPTDIMSLPIVCSCDTVS